MKNTTDIRIKNGKEVSTQTLIETIKAADPTRFDQMLIVNEERMTYYYVKYKALAYTREVKTLNFPLFKDLVNDFEITIENRGEVKILDDDRILQKVVSRGYVPVETRKYAGKNLAFSELKLETGNDKVKQKQSFYYLPSETDRHTCETCNGDKYTTCTEYECHGQHIYDCNQCGATGKIDCYDCSRTGHIRCYKCSGKGEYRCSGCSGKGEINCGSCSGRGRVGEDRCTRCSGRGFERCGNCRDGIIRCENCSGKGELRCNNCAGRGEITCSKCSGKRQITCGVCYGDHKDGRYGKVDCETCETAGELASITYIDTEILKVGQFRVVTDGKKITAPNFGLDTIKKFVDTNGQLIQTYKNHNGDTKENYDEYSSFCSKISLKEIGYYKDRYPKLIDEEMYYEGVPCATFNYNHFLSATFHDVSVLNIDKTKEVLFHSNPADVVVEKESFKYKINEWLRQAFSTKSFLDKIDRKHEMLLMLHIAKADGQIDEQEKRYLSQTISGLHGFTQKEKAELFGLMSVSILPPVLPTNAYFSSKERTEEARKKLVELVSKADGEYAPGVKTKLEEINKAIELGYKIKPTAIGRFLKTWQISVSLFIFLCLMCLIGYGVLYIESVYWSHLYEEELAIDTSEPVTEPETEPVTETETDSVTETETDSVTVFENDYVNESEAELESVSDIDNNLYQIVKIGSQYWFKSNLKVSRYNNGDNISSSLSNSAWANTTSGAYAIYNNDPVNDGLYGKLYNHFAVTDSRGLCPTGWHVPSDAEWTTLANHVGESSVAGGALKSTATQPTPGGWASPNAGATNSSGFTASPGGLRTRRGDFDFMAFNGFWWSSSVFSGSSAGTRGLDNDTSTINRYTTAYRTFGFSVRCCRD